jgi:hypothetical protein
MASVTVSSMLARRAGATLEIAKEGPKEETARGEKGEQGSIVPSSTETELKAEGRVIGK